MGTGGRTDMTNLVVGFGIFVKASKNEVVRDYDILLPYPTKSGH